MERKEERGEICATGKEEEGTEGGGEKGGGQEEREERKGAIECSILKLRREGGRRCKSWFRRCGVADVNDNLMMSYRRLGQGLGFLRKQKIKSQLGFS